MLRRRASFPRSILLVPVLLAMACGGGSGGSDADSGVVNCAGDPRVLAYAPNVTVTSVGTHMKYALVSSTPAPPARGLDDWTLRITDSAGQPLTTVPLAILTLMPEHGHGSPTIPQISNQGGGNYKVSQLNLFMPGIWRITFFPSNASSDTAEFWFCVQG